MNDDMLRPAGSPTVPNSRLTCAQCERMIPDAIDGTLLSEDQGQFDLHIAGCPSCSHAMEEAQKGAAWLSILKLAPPEPSSELLERILARTSGDPEIAIPVMRPDTILGGGRLASGRTYPGQAASYPAARVNWFASALQAITQPRFAMTAAMAFFSIALTLNLTGVQLRDLHASSLKPANVRHGFWAVNSKVVRYYDNLRIVYELESRVRELQRQEDDHPVESAPVPVATPPAGTKVPAGPKDPRSSNPTRGRAHTQAGLTHNAPTYLAQHDGAQAESATGKGGEGARSWMA